MRLAVVFVLAAVTSASAHYGASRSTRLRYDRHLSCNDGEDRVKVDCVGPIKARAKLLANLDPGELVPNKNHTTKVDAARDAALDAAYFSVGEAVPKIRPWLERYRPEARDANDHVMFDKQALRGEAAFALAHLGDLKSAPALAALVGEFEKSGTGSHWSDALAALAHLDPTRASLYAIGFVGRTTDWFTSMPGGSSKLAALDYIRGEHLATALPVLEKAAAREEKGYDHAHCELMAARARLDEKFRIELRKQLLASYSGSWLAGCANSVLARLGVAPGDAAALVRHYGRDDRGFDHGIANIAYSRTLELIATMASDRSAAAETARQVFRRGLEARSKSPHVADPGHSNYALHYVAMHHAALAALGDAAARTKVAALIDDPKDLSGAAWLAAYWSIRLRLPGALDRVAALAVRGVTTRDAHRTGIYEHIRGRTLDAFADAAPRDGRWAVMLLDADQYASERALYRFSRAKPPGGCEAVTRAAARIPGSSVMTQTDNAFLALTGLGDGCVPALETLFLDGKVTAEVRTSALEILAALESPRLCEHFKRAQRDRIFNPAASRAYELTTQKCN